jgi:hypothetical protein
MVVHIYPSPNPPISGPATQTAFATVLVDRHSVLGSVCLGSELKTGAAEISKPMIKATKEKCFMLFP